MKFILNIILILLLINSLNFTYWENVNTWSFLSWSNINDIKDNNLLSTWWIIKNNVSDADKAKLEQDLNILLIESYKTKLDQILDKLNYNIKNEIKEKQIKILTNILISVNNKISEILENKKISKNRKEILVQILSHIQNTVEQSIKTKLQESN